MKILKYAVFSLIGLTIMACTDLFETHKKYLEMAEETYIGRPDSLDVYGGLERVEVRWKLNADPRISKCLISWEGCEAPVVVDVANRPNESISKIINIPEGKYIFQLITVSESGKQSLPQTISGTSYGEKYQTLLSQRGMSSMVSTELGKVVINWLTEEGCLGVTMKYTNKDGEKKEVYVDAETTTTTLDDFEYGSAFTLTSTYLPEKNAIDNIDSKESILHFPLACNFTKADWDAIHSNYTDIDRTDWTAEANTEELEKEGAINGHVAALLDGNLGTFWHSQWFGGSVQLPHQIIIDMQTTQTISSIEVARRNNNGDTKTVVLSISEDKNVWTEIGTVRFPTDKLTNALTLLIPPTVSGRYMRATVTESYNGTATSLSEIMFTRPKSK